jgi:hypothetical protein
MIDSLAWILVLFLGGALTDVEQARAFDLYKRTFEAPIDHVRINALTDEEKTLLVAWFHGSLERRRRQGTSEYQLNSSPTADFLARLDDEWGTQAFASEFRRDPRRYWEGQFRFVRNARVIALIGEYLFEEEEYEIADDVELIPAQWSTARGVIETLKYAPQFLPDIGIWGKQLEDARAASSADVVKVLREWYRENEQKLREGKFQEIRPGRVPVVAAADPSEASRGQGSGQVEKAQGQGVQQPSAASAVAQSSEVPAWALWGAGALAILLALGMAFRRVFSSR